MLSRPNAPDSRYTNPAEPLAGKCLTCGSVVQCLRQDAVHQKKGTLGAWEDLLSVECPGCKARVFVMSSKDLKSVVE